MSDEVKRVEGDFRLGDLREALTTICDTGFSDRDAVHFKIIEPFVDEHGRIFNAELHIEIRDSGNVIVLYGYNKPEGLKSL